jgi:hypothetical protein
MTGGSTPVRERRPGHLSDAGTLTHERRRFPPSLPDERVARGMHYGLLPAAAELDARRTLAKESNP